MNKAATAVYQANNWSTVVTGTNDAPVAQAASFVVQEDGSLVSSAVAAIAPQLEPALREVIPYYLDADGVIKPAPGKLTNVGTIRDNADAGRELLASFAQQNDILLIDPKQAIVQAVLDNHDPFMVYDSHWNSLGHELVAREAARILQLNPCH